MGWLTDFTNWLTQTLQGLWTDLTEFFNDYILTALETVLNFVVQIINSISVPDFLDGLSICGMLTNAGPWAQWAISTFHLGEGLAAIASGIVFHFIRKFITLFQW